MQAADRIRLERTSQVDEASTYPVRRCHFWLLGAALALGGCSNKQIRADDLKSEVKQARELARECSQLIELREAFRLTENFRRTHELYLLKHAEELEKNLKDKSPSRETQQAFSVYKKKLASLMDSLRKLETDPQKQSFDTLDRDLKQLEEQL
jgi:hypothetical protein